MKYQGIMIVSDMDGTLISGGNTVTQKDAEAIKHFIKEGGIFTIASGRIGESIRLHTSEFKLNAPAICSNGSSCYDFYNEKEYWNINLDDRILNLLSSIKNLKENNVIHIFSGKLIYFIGCENVPNPDNGRNYKKLVTDISDVPLPWSKVFISSKDIDSLMEEVKNLKDIELFDITQSGNNNLELVPKGVNKGKALEKLTELLGIPMDRVIAVGDNINDIELIKTARIGIAVENANTKLKQVADFITPCPCGSALAYIIENLDNFFR